MRKILFKKRLMPYEEGLTIHTEEWGVVYETPCFFYCAKGFDLRRIDLLGGDKEAAKKLGIKLKRISKECSRFAFETEALAMNHLVMLKRKQIRHMERYMAFLKAFLSQENPESFIGNNTVIPGTRDLVHEYYRFD